MKRVVILGRGASGKSTFARRLGEITQLPVIELDKIFWHPELLTMQRDEWIAAQEKIAARERWIMDGDLGPYDAVDVRLRAADTVFILDFPVTLCVWRALQRSRERRDFWRWLLAYRARFLPVLERAIAQNASHAEIHLFRGPDELQRFVSKLAASPAARNDSQ